MKKLLMVCGPAAIGKSTFSKNYSESHSDEKITIIAADEIRKELCGGYDKFPPNNNMMIVYDEMIKRASNLCDSTNDITIIFDTTMLYDKRRMYFRSRLNNFDRYELILLKLHDYNQCLIRNKKRIEEKWVPDEVILDMAKCYEDPSEEVKSHFDYVEEIYVD